MKNFSANIIILILLLNTVPPLFREGAVLGYFDGELFDNVYFTILYFILGYYCWVVPGMNKELPISIKFISYSIAAWLTLAFMVELANLGSPYEVFNNHSDPMIYTISVTVMLIGTFIVKYEEKIVTWMNKRKN